MPGIDLKTFYIASERLARALAENALLHKDISRAKHWFKEAATATREVGRLNATP